METASGKPPVIPVITNGAASCFPRSSTDGSTSSKSISGSALWTSWMSFQVPVPALYIPVEHDLDVLGLPMAEIQAGTVVAAHGTLPGGRERPASMNPFPPERPEKRPIRKSANKACVGATLGDLEHLPDLPLDTAGHVGARGAGAEPLR